jgi:predicted anti-sigma-YlaC factor YlaD
MNDDEHVIPWLGAYLDGEATPALGARIEAHLVACAGCRSELEALRALSSLLKEIPEPALATSDAVFAAQVLEQVRLPAPPWWQRALRAGWRYAPVLLFAVWAFFQAVSWVAGGLLAALDLLPGADAALGSLLPEAGADAPLLLDLLRFTLLDPSTSLALEGLSWLDSLVPLAAFNLLLLVLLGVLFLGWLASWWSYRQAQNTIWR